MATQEQHVYRFGEFALEPRERSLRHRDAPVALTGKAFDLLVALVSQAGHLVTKDELLQQVWPGLVVEEVNLSVNVSALRKALAVAGEAPDWIETVPRQGYRFKGPVRIEDAANASQIKTTRRTARALWVAAGVALVGLVLGATLWVGRAQPYESVAVLPFQADNAADVYLAEGLTERLIEKLAQVPGLRVVPRASAYRFNGKAAAEAGQQLGTPAVVTGVLTRGASGVTLRVELVDVQRRAPVWNRQYDRADLPNVPERLALDVVQAVGPPPPERESSVPRAAFTASAEAYQQYLQGRYLWNQRSERALQQAIGHFQKAIELDPNFALAYAGLADAHTTLGYLGHVSPVSTFSVARPYALKALQLDPTLAQAHAALAYIKFYFDWDWPGAAQEFRRALELAPSDPVAHQWYAVYLRAAGQGEQAQREIEIAQRLDPLSLAINTDVGFHHYYAGRYPEAIAQLQTVLGMKPDFVLAHLWLARALIQVGRLEEGLAETAYAEKGAREWPVLMTARGFTNGVMGRREEARVMLREMQQLSSRRFVTAYGMALVHAGLGEKEEAFRWLDKAFEERSHWLVWLRLDPRWTSLRGDPRFEALIQRMNYPA